MRGDEHDQLDLAFVYLLGPESVFQYWNVSKERHLPDRLDPFIEDEPTNDDSMRVLNLDPRLGLRSTDYRYVIGGIPLQVTHKYSGLLCRTIEGAALQIREFLHSPEYAHRLGLNGKEHIRQNFLLTRHLRDYLLLFLALEHPGKDIISL